MSNRLHQLILGAGLLGLAAGAWRRADPMPDHTARAMGNGVTGNITTAIITIITTTTAGVMVAAMIMTAGAAIAAATTAAIMAAAA